MYVSVATPAANWQTRTPLLTYAVPDDLSETIQPGQLVAIPYGQRLAEGIIWEILADKQVRHEMEILELDAILDLEPALLPHQMALASWMADYYMTPLASVAVMMLPPGLMRRSETVLTLAEGALTGEAEPTSLRLQALQGLLLQDGEIDLETLRKKLGPTRARELLKDLRQDARFVQKARLSTPKARERVQQVIAMGTLPENADLTERQQAALTLLSTMEKPLTRHGFLKVTGLTEASLRSLIAQGILLLVSQQMRRDPLAGVALPANRPLPLTDEQATALQTILDPRSSGRVLLLHGVTGSGKTEVYLQAMARMLEEGKRSILLVPEIALTTQAIQRVASRFPERVAIIHSELSMGERHDEWQRIRRGEVDIVIGSRSALFAPLPDLGLLIIDEEHEPAYKQSERRPTYHVRDAARFLAGFLGVPLVLGSATPSIESFYRAKRGEYLTVTMRHRIGISLPPVSIVDLREELAAGHQSILSRQLLTELTRTLEAKEQAILFLNRRGTASCVLCRSCGFVVLCERCDVPLTYHASGEKLICHYCGHREKTIQSCPACHSPEVRYFGVGTEKVEATLRTLFPEARLLRWDRDTARNRRAHEQLLEQFASRKADILIGTQMIAKGLDLPDVTLVGAISADIALNLPDISAAERTFSLLTQVAGRAGRGQRPGKVIIQTFNPEHFCITTASKHDYHTFYQGEIAARERHGYPPFRQLVKLTYSHANRQRCQNEALLLIEQISSWIEQLELRHTDYVGPTPAAQERLRGKYRWQIILRGEDLHALLSVLDMPDWHVDIDPLSTM